MCEKESVTRLKSTDGLHRPSGFRRQAQPLVNTFDRADHAGHNVHREPGVRGNSRGGRATAEGNECTAVRPDVLRDRAPPTTIRDADLILEDWPDRGAGDPRFFAGCGRGLRTAVRGPVCGVCG